MFFNFDRIWLLKIKYFLFLNMKISDVHIQ